MTVMWREWGRRETYAGFWRGNLTDVGKWAELGVEGGIILKWVLKK